MPATSPARARRVLVIANETCVGSELFRVLRERAVDGDADVLVVAPALTTRLRYWLSDEDPGIAAAGRRLERSLERCGAAGVVARGALGDADPLQALDDAMRTFDPDEVVVATHPEGASNWLERGLVAQARERYAVPITHLAVDPVHEEARVIERERDARGAPARERHASRDLTVLAIVAVLAIVGSALSFVLYLADAPTWALATWVVIVDLGFKIAAAVTLWVLFQRRARADRLDF